MVVSTQRFEPHCVSTLLSLARSELTKTDLLVFPSLGNRFSHSWKPCGGWLLSGFRRVHRWLLLGKRMHVSSPDPLQVRRKQAAPRVPSGVMWSKDQFLCFGDRSVGAQTRSAWGTWPS